MSLMSTVLHELDDALGTAAGTWAAGGCTAAPLDGLPPIAADDPYLLSGVAVSCPPGADGTPPAARRVYRLTPRCLDEHGCASRPAGLAAGARAEIRIFSGWTTSPVEDGCWWPNARNSSAAGFWIVAPCPPVPSVGTQPAALD